MSPALLLQYTPSTIRPCTPSPNLRNKKRHCQPCSLMTKPSLLFMQPKHKNHYIRFESAILNLVIVLRNESTRLMTTSNHPFPHFCKLWCFSFYVQRKIAEQYKASLSTLAAKINITPSNTIPW